MNAPAPLFVREKTAARLLDMQPAEFRSLVQAGALPGPANLGRWDVQQLIAIMRGDAHRPAEDFELEI